MIRAAPALRVPPRLAAFWSWWSGEIAAAWAQLGRRRGSSGSARILIEPGLVAVERLRGDESERFEENRAFDTFDDQNFAELIALTDGMPTRLVLTEPDLFVAAAALPKATRSRLREAIALRLVELAPLPPAELAWAIADEQAIDDRLDIKIVMTRAARLDMIADRFEAHDRPVPRMFAATPWGEIALPLAGRGAGRLAALLSRHLHLAIALLLLATIPVTIWIGSLVLAVRAEQRIDAISDEVRTLRAANRKAHRMESERRLLMPLSGQAGAAAILNGIAGTLPPTDWLRAIERRRDGSMVITVVSTDEDALDQALRTNALLPGVRVADRSPLDDGTTEVTYETSRP